MEASDTLQNKYGLDLLVCERLEGPEFSVFGIADGESIRPIELALQDHKRRDNNDKGPNTGGMGAYGPAPIAPPEVIQQVTDTVMTPIILHAGHHRFSDTRTGHHCGIKASLCHSFLSGFQTLLSQMAASKGPKG